VNATARPPAGHLSVDLHVHTVYSKDSLTSLDRMIAAVQRAGLTAVAITDHNQVEGAMRLRDRAPFPVIVGEEIRTSEGEITGLYLRERIAPRLSPEETIAAIREQGGIVYLPHPADAVRTSTIRPAALERVIVQVDAVEVINARVMGSSRNAEARRLAERHGLAQGAGSDAHTPAEVGTAYVLVPECDLNDASSFLGALSRGRPMGGLSSPLVHLASTWAKIRKRLPGALPPQL